MLLTKKKVFQLILVELFQLVLILPCHSHEIRPAYLEIKQVSLDTYDVLWKLPSRFGAVPKIYPSFPKSLKVIPKGFPEPINGSLRQVFKGKGTRDLHGEFIGVDGLSKTLIDVLVNIEFLKGERHTFILQPDNPRVLIPEKPGFGNVALTYIRLGIVHILFGIDHLLFVLALLLITKGFGRLVKTITAFTIAHSITLSLAALGVVGLPGAPVEAVIALSIVFLAGELVHFYNGREGLTVRFPWIVAFTFGLLHGFGFAGALTEIGLPQHAIPVALLFFNVGVEIGQLVFIMAVMGLIWMLNRLKFWPRWFRLIPPYVIGSIAAFWLIERVLGFL